MAEIELLFQYVDDVKSTFNEIARENKISLLIKIDDPVDSFLDDIILQLGVEQAKNEIGLQVQKGHVWINIADPISKQFRTPSCDSLDNRIINTNKDLDHLPTLASKQLILVRSCANIRAKDITKKLTTLTGEHQVNAVKLFKENIVYIEEEDQDKTLIKELLHSGIISVLLSVANNNTSSIVTVRDVVKCCRFFSELKEAGALIYKTTIVVNKLLILLRIDSCQRIVLELLLYIAKKKKEATPLVFNNAIEEMEYTGGKSMDNPYDFIVQLLKKNSEASLLLYELIYHIFYLCKSNEAEIHVFMQIYNHLKSSKIDLSYVSPETKENSDEKLIEKINSIKRKLLVLITDVSSIIKNNKEHNNSSSNTGSKPLSDQSKRIKDTQIQKTAVKKDLKVYGVDFTPMSDDEEETIIAKPTSIASQPGKPPMPGLPPPPPMGMKMTGMPPPPPPPMGIKTTGMPPLPPPPPPLPMSMKTTGTLPPPPPMGMGLPPPPSMAKQVAPVNAVASKKYKPLQWTKGTPNIANTIWMDVLKLDQSTTNTTADKQAGLSGLNDIVDEVSDHFILVEKKKVDAKQETKKRLVITVLDGKAAQNIGLMVAKCPPRREVRDIIEKMDSTRVNKEGLQRILNFFSSDDEFNAAVQSVKAAESSEDNKGLMLAEPEAYVKALGEVASCRDRLRCWLTMLELEDEVLAIVKPLYTLLECITEIKNSQTFKVFLGLVLKFGNTLNQGNNRLGNATSINITSLEKLTSVRDIEGSGNLLTHCIRILKSNRSHLKGLPQELAALDSVVMNNYEGMDVSIGKIKDSIEESIVHINKLGLNNAGTDEFKLQARLNIEKTNTVYTRIMHKYKKMLLYLGHTAAESNKLAINDYFKKLREFVFATYFLEERAVNEEIKKAEKRAERKKIKDKEAQSKSDKQVTVKKENLRDLRGRGKIAQDFSDYGSEIETILAADPSALSSTISTNNEMISKLSTEDQQLADKLAFKRTRRKASTLLGLDAV